MALLQPDLSIYGQQKPIPILSPDQIALQQANEEAKRDALRQKRQALLDDAASRRAMQESIDPNTGAVDYGRLSGLLGKYGASPATIEGVQTKIDTHIEKLLTQQKLRDEHNAAYQKFVAERIGAIDSQDKLDMARELYPDLAGALPKDYENGKPQIALLAQSASTESEKATMRKQAAEELRASRAFDAGTPERLANGLAATAKLLANDTPDGYQQAMNGGLKTLGIDDAIIARLPPQYDPQKLAALSMTPKDQAELAGQAESRANTAANMSADNARQDAAQKSTEAYQATLGRAAMIRANKVGQSAGGTAAGAPPRSTMPDEAINQAADRYFETGILPSLGMGNAAASDKRAIMARAGERHPGATIAYNTAAFAANKNTLTKLQNQSTAIAAFENTASKNLQQFEDLAAKIPDTGVPWLNTPVRALTQQMVGSANMAAVNAARQVALTEISRVVSNPNLTGALSDSAREEVLGLVPANATLKQIQRVANVLRTDMQNRRTSIDEQKADIEKRLGKDDGAAQKPAQKPANLIYDPATGTFKKGGG